jgi:hypothetical protein
MLHGNMAVNFAMKLFLRNTQLLLIWLKLTGSSTIKTKRNAALPQRQWLRQRATMLRYMLHGSCNS